MDDMKFLQIPESDWNEVNTEAAMLREALALLEPQMRVHNPGCGLRCSQCRALIEVRHEAHCPFAALSSSSGEWLARHDAEFQAHIKRLRSELTVMIDRYDRECANHEDSASQRDFYKIERDSVQAALVSCDDNLAATQAQLTDQIKRVNAVNENLYKALERAEKAEQESDELAGKLADEERFHLHTIDQRDAAEEAFTSLAAELNVETEYSNLRGYADIHNDCVEVISQIKTEAQKAALKTALIRLSAKRTTWDDVLVELEAMVEEAHA